jgi:hypothetical protein
MIEWHPTDFQLASLSDEGASSGGRKHIRSCARCRSAVADYEWLEAELAATLETAAKRARSPRATWWELQNRLNESRHLQVVRLRASAVLSAAMTVCLLLCAPSLIKPAAAAQAPRPAVSVRPTPIAIAESTEGVDGSLSSRTSTLLTALGTAQQSSVAPSLVPLPTPPDCEP